MFSVPWKERRRVELPGRRLILVSAYLKGEQESSQKMFHDLFIKWFYLTFLCCIVSEEFCLHFFFF